MPRWKITQSDRGKEGEIVAVYGPSRGYLTTPDVIADIESGTHSYYVKAGPYESEVRVVEAGTGKTITTMTDIFSPNHLHNLPPATNRFWRSR